jgi:hypothetical protein
MDEAKISAVIDMIQWVRRHQVIFVSRFPKKRKDMLRNLLYFSDEGRYNQTQKGRVPMFCGATLTRCYGWMKLDYARYPRRPYCYDAEYLYALVYEHVPMVEVVKETSETTSDSLDKLVSISL